MIQKKFQRKKAVTGKHKQHNFTKSLSTWDRLIYKY